MWCERKKMGELRRILGEELDMTAPALAQKSDSGSEVAGSPFPTVTFALETSADFKKEGFGRGKGDQLGRPTMRAARSGFRATYCPWAG